MRCLMASSLGGYLYQYRLKQLNKKTARIVKNTGGLFFIVFCFNVIFSSFALANLITVDGIKKGDQSQVEQQFHQGMQAYIESDYINAYNIWKQAEVSNNAKASFNLGRMWMLGQVPGQAKDKTKANIYFKKSARLGYAPAIKYLQGSDLNDVSLTDDSQPESINDVIVGSRNSTTKNEAQTDSKSTLNSANEWLNNYSDDKWVIQIFASKEPTLLKQMVRDFALTEQTYILTETINNQRWFKLIYGEYESKDEALEARKSLPARVRVERPWIRAISAIKRIQKSQ